MEINPVYQTIEDRNNPDEIEKNGPIKGINNPWLGEGYYFWDGFIENAHWWGKCHIKKEYIICEATINCDDTYILDLYGNPEDMKYFSETLKLISKKLNKETLTVSNAIAFLQKHSKSFNNYKIIRAESPNCGSPQESYPFVNGHISKLNLIRPIQICVIDKALIKNYKIIYPEEYNTDWVG